MKIKLSNENSEYIFNSNNVIIIGNKLYELLEEEKKDLFNGKIFKKYLDDYEKGFIWDFDLGLYIHNAPFYLEEYDMEVIK